MSFVNDSGFNRDSSSRHNYKSSAANTDVCQGCEGDPSAYFSLVGEQCHACKGTGKRES